MPAFDLFAARDGNVLYDIGDFREYSGAESWAARRIAQAFKLDAQAGQDFESARGECDGVLLRVRS